MTNSPLPQILISAWRNGVFVFSNGTRQHELAGRPVRGLARDGHGGALAIVEGNSLYRRWQDGTWEKLAQTDFDLACCTAVGDAIYAGTDDARVLLVQAGGRIEELRSFATIAGRGEWYAGGAVVNGEYMGPPLGVRSIAATSDGAAILANVHVGGIARSTDGGETWHPTIDIHADVHEVCAHPDRAEVVVAAAGIGLCISLDGGATWKIEKEGLHATYCSAVAFAGDDVLVAASVDHFAPQGKVYRRQRERPGAAAAFPDWTDGIVDTACISTQGSTIAVADKKGNLYDSTDAGQSWSRQAEALPTPSALLVL